GAPSRGGSESRVTRVIAAAAIHSLLLSQQDNTRRRAWVPCSRATGRQYPEDRMQSFPNDFTSSKRKSDPRRCRRPTRYSRSTSPLLVGSRRCDESPLAASRRRRRPRPTSEELVRRYTPSRSSISGHRISGSSSRRPQAPRRRRASTEASPGDRTPEASSPKPPAPYRRLHYRG